jgi:hypothetical protein
MKRRPLWGKGRGSEKKRGSRSMTDRVPKMKREASKSVFSFFSSAGLLLFS